MILYAIGVRAFGPFRDGVRLAGLDPGLNILWAPNEAGKSSLFAALHHGFFTPYKSADQSLKQMVPWDTNLGPAVEIEFEHNSVRYRLRKRFLSGGSCDLGEWAGTRYVVKYQDERADEFVRDLLLGAKPAKGAAKAEHSGLARLLWVPQGAESLVMPTPSLVVSTRIKASLDSGSVVEDDAERSLVAALRGRYGQTYTDQRGHEKSASDLARARLDLGEAIRRLDAVRGELGQVREDADDLARRQALLRQLDQRSTGVAGRLAELERQAEEVRAIRAEFQVVEAKRAAATQRRTTVGHDLEAYQAKSRRLGEIAAELPLARDAAVAAGQVFDRLSQEEVASRKRLESADKSLDEAQQLRDRAAKQRLAQTEIGRLASLAARAADVEEAEERIAGLDARLTAMPLVDRAVCEEAAALELEIRDLRAQVRGAGVTVTFDFDPARNLSFCGSDGEGTARTGPGTPFDVFTLDRLDIEIGGVGRIEVVSGAGSARELEAAADAKQERLSALLGKNGAHSAADLDRRMTDRQELEREIGEIRRLNQTRMDGYASLGHLREAIAELRGTHSRRLAELHTTADALATAEIPPESGLDAACVQAQEAKRSAAAALGDLRVRLESARRESDQASARAEALVAEQVKHQEASVEILARYDRSPAILEEAAAAAAAEAARLEEQKRALADRLPKSPDEDPEHLASGVKGELADLSEEIAADQVLARRLEFRVEEAAAKGLYQQETEFEERSAALQAEVNRLDIRGRAVKLLLALAEERQRRRSADLLGPLSDRATELWGAVTGIPDRRVVFTDDLGLRGVFASGAERPLDPFSGGAREQLFLVARLALAEILARHERRFMVVDDTLVYSDPRRRERLMALLCEASEHLQIVVLTCDADRYSHLDAAKRLDLEQAVEA